MIYSHNPCHSLTKHDLANWTPADQLTEQKAEKLTTSDSLIQEIKDSDTLVIGVSMYNSSIPASLKAWVDLVCRAGHTFQHIKKAPLDRWKASAPLSSSHLAAFHGAHQWITQVPI
ncbi:MAG: NAD(P)H-dependent oxidoreductase [Ascidiaceihabitans sp.]